MRSLLRLQCVLKSWQSLITDPSFRLHSISAGSYSIICHCLCGDPDDPADRFYRLKFERSETDDDDHDDGVIDYLRIQLHKFDRYKELGSSNGLICHAVFINYGPDCFILCLWNPSINRYKKVFLVPPSARHCSSKYNYRLHKIGFGFCGINGFNDYRLVHVHFHHTLPASCADNSYCSGHVNVYSLTSDSWKSLPSTSISVPSHLATYNKLGHGHWWGTYAFVGGVYYWLLCRDRDDSYSLVAFDLVNETFLGDKVALPKLFRPSCVHRLYLFEFGESVALYEAVDEFRKGCLWVSRADSINDCNSGTLTWIRQFSIVVDDAKDLLTDKRLPYSLRMKLKYHENIEKPDPYNFCYEGYCYYAEETTYNGTYVKSLALLGMPSMSLPCVIDDELDAEDYAYIYADDDMYEFVDF